MKLLEAWHMLGSQAAPLQKASSFVDAVDAWRLQALGRFCGLVVELRTLKAALRRNQTDRLRRLQAIMKRRGFHRSASGVDATVDMQLEELEREEHTLAQRLSQTQEVEVAIRARCEAAIGSSLASARLRLRGAVQVLIRNLRLAIHL